MLALQIGHGPDGIVCDQLHTAEVQTRQYRERDAGIEVAERPWSEPAGEINFPTLERLRQRRT
jgi:hypothetical protein